MLFKALYNVHIWNDHGRGHYLCYQIFDIIEFSFSIDYSMVYDFKLFWVQFLLNGMMFMLHEDMRLITTQLNE